ncbi:MAG: hypothetical protein AB7U46_13505 [Paenirhodobacter sp.]|uniref:hypothetical protein n=1 Tax=Paenirhodobacter sp. TaxID=1965326 RepID=UPI003D099F35
MRGDILLVTGIHRVELAFGDHVASGPGMPQVMRIPHGIARPRRGPGDAFLSRTQHREIYLQLYQQIAGRYRLVIDLHQGLDEAGRSAEIFCNDSQFLARCEARLACRSDRLNARLVRIAAPASGAETTPEPRGATDAAAYTWIPRKLWEGRAPLYVGVEVYLPRDGEGEDDDWSFGRDLIGEICACVSD